jgi:hypothetical protein
MIGAVSCRTAIASLGAFAGLFIVAVRCALVPSAGGFEMAGKARDAFEGVLTASRRTSACRGSHRSRVIALAQAFAQATPGELGL